MQAAETTASRDRLLTMLAILMGLMAISNFSKPLTQHFDASGQAGFVFLGHRLHGAANAIVGPLFGALLAAYAYGVWTLRRWVLPIALGYAGYVIVNLVSFWVSAPGGERPPAAFMLLYAVIAIGVSSGGAAYLLRRRSSLQG